MMQSCNVRIVILLLAAIAGYGVQAACNANDHHPEDGGYYIEGIDGVDNDQRDTVNGKRADKTTWVPDKYYPHGELKLCTGQFCSEESRTKGTAQYVVAHTCARLRFSYSSDSTSTVYEMFSLHDFLTCNFTNAHMWADTSDGTPHYDYIIEDDHEKKVYYFASKHGCESGQKVAVQVVDDYANNALQCANMGLGSSRIQHCDCNHQLKGTTLIDPCHTAFANACMSDMPDDQSCCPDPSKVRYDSATRSYVYGGTCVPKSKHQTMQQTVIDTVQLCQTNVTACDVYESLTSCPSRYNPSAYDPKCNQWKSIKKCESATGTIADECATDLLWIMYQRHLSTTTAEQTDLSHASSAGVLASVLFLVAAQLNF